MCMLRKTFVTNIIQMNVQICLFKYIMFKGRTTTQPQTKKKYLCFSFHTNKVMVKMNSVYNCRITLQINIVW